LVTTFKEQDNFVQIQGENRVKQGFVSTERYVNIFSEKKTAASPYLALDLPMNPIYRVTQSL
jgi:hypothetical protein